MMRTHANDERLIRVLEQIEKRLAEQASQREIDNLRKETERLSVAFNALSAEMATLRGEDK